MGAATTQVIGQFVFDLLLIGLWVALKQSDQRHDHAVGAITALCGLLIDKTLLHRMQLPRFTEAFQRGNGFIERTAQRNGTRTSSNAIDQHRTGTALPQTTAVFGAV
ncbi:hypothetical protein D3C80_1298530 [compost metagenome]